MTYVANLIKKKAPTYTSQSIMSDVMQKARKTIEVLSKNLITMDVTNEKIFSLYADKETLSQSERRENAVKLLLRCKKMYEAR